MAMNKTDASQKAGFTLLETLVAILILAILAIGGAAVLYRTGGSIQVQGNKRVAVEIANSFMEREKAIPYQYIVTPSNTNETRRVDGIEHTITVKHTKHVGKTLAEVFKHIEVEVTYNPGGDTVSQFTDISYKSSGTP